MAKGQGFKSADAISTLLRGTDENERRSCLFEFIGYIFHPYDHSLRLLDRDVLGIKYLFHAALNPTTVSEAPADLLSNSAYIRRLGGVLFRDDLYDSVGLNGFWARGQLLMADIVRFVLKYPLKPSINKDHYFVTEAGGFKHARNRWPLLESDYNNPGWKSFHDQWNELKSVCAFHFADVYCFEGAWRDFLWRPISRGTPIICSVTDMLWSGTFNTLCMWYDFCRTSSTLVPSLASIACHNFQRSSMSWNQNWRI